MPSIETMLLDYEGQLGVRPQKVFNIDAAVGRGAPNKPGDVMLVQAMLREISLLVTYAFHNVTLPEATGRIDKNTLDSILAYQITNSAFLLSVDGRIDPASLAGRKLRLKAGKQTMIQFLNRYLEHAISIKRNENDYIQGLLKLYPQLRVHVRDKTKISIGGLNFPIS